MPLGVAAARVNPRYTVPAREPAGGKEQASCSLVNDLLFGVLIPAAPNGDKDDLLLFSFIFLRREEKQTPSDPGKCCFFNMYKARRTERR
jgi:hypothetical protein